MAPSPAIPMLQWMAVLADGTRARMLRALERRDLTVAEICSVLQLPQSTVSRHLKTLADHGWVGSRREGTRRLYRMGVEALEPAARRLWALLREQAAGMPASERDDRRLAAVLAERASQGKAFFNSAAAQWDKLRGELYGRSFTHEALFALLPPAWTVADLGCGTGHAAANLASHVRHVIGVDQSAAMLKAARQRTGGAGNVDLRRGELEALPIDDAACNAALMVLVLTYVPDLGPALAEARRILKPGGRLVLVDLARHDRDDFRQQMGQHWLGFEPKELAAALSAAGFAAVAVRLLPTDPMAKGPGMLLAAATRDPLAIDDHDHIRPRRRPTTTNVAPSNAMTSADVASPVVPKHRRPPGRGIPR